MSTIKSMLLVTLFGFINFSFSSTKLTTHNDSQLAELETLNQELITAYNKGENFTVVDKTGKEYLNPNRADLLKLSPELFNENRIRVTISGRSDNDLCSTELVIMNKSGKLEGNYSVNSCSSYGWIFFTQSNCFEIALFHDAGSEAPYGSSINGSVDWTFEYNRTSKISGTYMDQGAANMFKIASPCFDVKNLQKIKGVSAKKTVNKRNFGF